MSVYTLETVAESLNYATEAFKKYVPAARLRQSTNQSMEEANSRRPVPVNWADAHSRSLLQECAKTENEWSIADSMEYRLQGCAMESARKSWLAIRNAGVSCKYMHEYLQNHPDMRDHYRSEIAAAPEVSATSDQAFQTFKTQVENATAEGFGGNTYFQRTFARIIETFGTFQTDLKLFTATVDIAQFNITQSIGDAHERR